jgi:hypothetical protein
LHKPSGSKSYQIYITSLNMHRDTLSGWRCRANAGCGRAKLDAIRSPSTKPSNIAITEARETTQNVTDTWFKQSGLTLALSSPVVNAIQTADQMAKAASNTSDSRMKALAAASTGDVPPVLSSTSL